jgi:hypothetical protein
MRAARPTWKRGSEAVMGNSRLGLLLWVGAALLLGCSHSRNPATLSKVAGDAQVGAPGGELAQPLVVKVADGDGRPVAGVTVLWSVVEGGGSIKAAIATTGEDGLATALARLGPAAASNRYQASTQNWAVYSVTFQATHSPFTLSYTDPPAGGKLRLVRGADSTPSAVLLELQVAPGASVSAYSVGFNLPLDASRVSLDRATPMIPGALLDPGKSPAAAMAALPTSGPLKGTLVSGQSHKASGAGAVTTDTLLPAGTVLYTLKLDILPTATPGVVFDGTAAGFVLPSAGARDRLGQTVVAAGDVVVGKLIVK